MSHSASATATRDPLTSNTGADFVRMRIDLIDPHPENPRKIDDDHPSLDGLAQSIRETGLINPITVRQEGSRCIILAGERRWRAARKAGIDEIVVRVVDVTDEQAFHILTVENLQREDLHWLEEARGVESMVRRGWDVAEIAKHVGRSEQWVRLRAKLAGISPKWRKAVEDPRHLLHGWSASMLELVARFPIEMQDTMLDEDWLLERASTTAELAKVLDEHYQRNLKSAPWSIDDEKLVPSAGACSACPKRSSCQQQLFAEAKEDRCLDRGCWTAKHHAHAAHAVAAAQKEHPKATLVVMGDRGPDGSDLVPPNLFKRAVGTHGMIETKPDAKGAKPAIVAGGSRAGEVVWLKAREHSQSAQSSETTPKRGKELPPKEQLAVRMKARAKAVLIELIERLGGDAAGGYGKSLKAKCAVPAPLAPELMALAAIVGVTGDYDFDAPQLLALVKCDQGKISDRLWLAVRESLVEQLQGDTHDGDLSRARAVAEICEVDIGAIEKEVQTDLPLAKSLAESFEEDGTPKEGLTVTKPAAKPSQAKAAAKPKATKAKSKKPAKAKSKG